MSGELLFEALGSSSSSASTDQLRQKGIYYITGDIDNDSLLEIHQDILLKHLNPDWKDDIQVIVNSPGGSMPEGWALIDLLNWVRMDVRTIGIGFCASLGAILLASGTRGKRVISQNTAVMVHGPSIYGLQGNKQELVNAMKDVDFEYNRHVKFWTEHSNYTEEQVKKQLLDGQDRFYLPDEAIKLGLADIVVEYKKKVPCAPTGKKKKTKK